MRQVLTVIGLVAASLVLGFGLGRWTSAGPGAVTSDTATSPKSVPADAARREPSASVTRVAAGPAASSVEAAAGADPDKQLLKDPGAIRVRVRQLSFSPKDTQRIYQFQRLAAQIDPINIPATLEEIKEDHQGLFSEFRALLVMRWAQTDPQAALSFAQTIKDDARDQLIGVALDGWAEHDVAGALEWAGNLPTSYTKTTSMRSLINAWARQDPMEALAFLKKSNLSDPHLYSVVLGQLAMVDVEAAGREAVQLPPGPVFTEAVYVVARVWAQSDPPAAMTFIQSLPIETVAQRIASVVLYHWSKQDWRAVLAWSQQATPGPVQQRAAELALEACAQQDWRLALEQIDQLSSGFHRTQVLGMLVSAWAQEDPRAALAYVRTLPQNDHAIGMARGILVEWSRRDPATVAAELDQMPADSARAKIIQNLANHWADNDLPRTVEWVKTLSDRHEQGLALTAVLSKWGTQDPASACRFLMTTDRQDIATGAMEGMVRLWANHDARAVLQWAEQLPRDSPQRAPAIQGSVMSWAERQPQSAAAYVAAMPPGAVRQNLLAAVSSQWALQDAGSARAWAEHLSGPDRELVMPAVAAALAGVDPKSAIALWAALPDGPGKNGTRGDILHQWAQTDPAAAMAWAEASDDEAERAPMMESVLGLWAHAQPRNAEAWLQRQPDSPMRSRLATRFVQAVLRSRPSLAARWIEETPPEQRQPLAERLARTWLELDAVEARQWLRQAPLPEAVKTGLIEAHANRSELPAITVRNFPTGSGAE